ncbi:hypothetical protein KL86PLE_130063 [uncultured Pleomorphomonas sp.]|uniref:Uncharacterized protein n=1 Tax=uncultured Pleomorphomonas sp. TaxID=442121 RepID=A0A212L902_9HYPH|nr:hypothetical protein KL86PLE_130063 [uncultured Pleomorphomonas sp.]
MAVTRRFPECRLDSMRQVFGCGKRPARVWLYWRGDYDMMDKREIAILGEGAAENYL